MRRDIEADKIISIQRGHFARFGAARAKTSSHQVLVMEGNHRAQGTGVRILEGPQRVSTQSQGDSQDVNTKQRVFVLSSIESNQAREHYASIIVALGGQVSDKPSFDPATTHLVCDRPVRSEKLLANIAAGNWVLHTSYLFKSHEEGHFLPEEQFEWGNPDSSAVLSHIKQDNHIALLAKAVHRWRVKLSRAPVGVGAFSGMRVLVNVGKDRGDQFKRLVMAGGGQVVSLSDWQTATMCLVDPSKVSLDKPISLASFATHNIPCVPTLFLNDYLVMDTPPSMSESAIPQYKERERRLPAYCFPVPFGAEVQFVWLYTEDADKSLKTYQLSHVNTAVKMSSSSSEEFLLLGSVHPKCKKINWCYIRVAVPASCCWFRSCMHKSRLVLGCGEAPSMGHSRDVVDKSLGVLQVSMFQLLLNTWE
uniref:BRCT domain-containing protein n=1 Tax=Timema cristinae TaxID=61476 RepID=A0A7R9CDV0_TIMCR|nr:unnamed protein product [Timema cristinae]